MKMLAVDDDPRLLRIIEMLLQRDGHEVTALSDSKAALKLLKKEKFDLVVSDRTMPDVTGDAVLKQAKIKNPEGLTIMLTGLGDIMNDEGDLPDGVDTVLSKPVTGDDFRSVIGGMIDASSTA
jgi:DNA-binding response OmpR family regulator